MMKFLEYKNTQNISYIPYPKLLFFVLFFLFSTHSVCAQFYVQTQTILSVENYNTILSSQEPLNQIDAHITGKGTLYLNGTSNQIINSTQLVLALPNLQLANADFAQIATELSILHQLTIEKGILVLTHQLVLNNEGALVLGATAGILNTRIGQLVYNTQLETSNPLAVIQTIHLFKYRVPSIPQARPNLTVATRRTSNFGRIVNKNYHAYFKHETPHQKRFSRCLVSRIKYLVLRFMTED